MKRQLLMVCAALAIAATFVPTAPAQDFGCGGYGVGLGYNYGALYNSLYYRVPHFAAHPPVYYSYPVPRPYGYSPFAYPPYVKTPEILGVAEPEMIINPYVPSSHEPSSETGDQLTGTSAPQPLVIHNPFVEQGSRLASAAR